MVVLDGLMSKIFAKNGLLLLSFACTLLWVAVGSNNMTVSCQTPLAFSESRLPAILEVENNCANIKVAVCFEYDKALYLVQHIAPTALKTFATVYDDCWVFRATDCNGATLLEHQVGGTRKLTVGCTKEETDANSLLNSQSTGLDCSLTVTPQLTDVFNASLAAVPEDVQLNLSDHLFEHRKTPTQFVNKEDLLSGVYDMCYLLCRHGASVNGTFNLFRHIRAVIRHTENCNPSLVGDEIGIAHAYLALYGYVFALAHATYRKENTWVDDPQPLTPSQRSSYENVKSFAMGVDLAMAIPASVLPGPSEGIGLLGELSVRMEKNLRLSVKNVYGGMAVNSSVESQKNRTRLGQQVWLDGHVTGMKGGGNVSVDENKVVRNNLDDGSGVDLCNSKGQKKWIFKKFTKENSPNSTVDCCSPSCLLFQEVVAPKINMKSFEENCCLSCNMGWCSDEMPPRVVAVMHNAEIQLQEKGNKALQRPFKVIVI